MTQKAAPGRKIELPGAAFSQERVTAGLRVASAVLARSAVSVGCLDRAERGGSVRKAALGGEPELVHSIELHVATMHRGSGRPDCMMLGLCVATGNYVVEISDNNGIIRQLRYIQQFTINNMTIGAIRICVFAVSVASINFVPSA